MINDIWDASQEPWVAVPVQTSGHSDSASMRSDEDTSKTLLVPLFLQI
jgi:hypothetical protein